MKKFIILSLIGIFTLTAYGGLNTKVVKEKTDITYSIVALGDLVAGYVGVNLPEARARESFSFSIKDLEFKFYGPDIMLTEARQSWQDRSNRLWLTSPNTHYKAIAKPFNMPAPLNPPKIC